MRYIFFFLFSFMTITAAHAQWYNEYKRGIIEIKPDANFAAKTVWEDIIYNDVHDIAVADNGTIFMTNGQSHNFFIISPSGDLLKTLSQRGEGPTDLYSPSKPEILDNKYLVIGEFPECYRISIYHLSGVFFKKLRTQHPPFCTVALKNNKIAYYSQRTLSQYQSAKQRFQHSIYIKDIQTGAEKLIDTYILEGNNDPRSRIKIMTFFYNTFLIATADGHLLVGSSNHNRLNIYTEQGIKEKSITLKLNPIPVTDDVISKYKLFHLQEIVNESTLNERERRVSLFKKTSLKDFAGPTLPLYSFLTVDSDGNLLVCKFPPDPGNINKTFQVYSKDGTYLCEWQLKPGKYNIDLNHYRRNLLFTKDGIIGIFKTETEEDTIYKLMRVKRQ